MSELFTLLHYMRVVDFLLSQKNKINKSDEIYLSGQVNDLWVNWISSFFIAFMQCDACLSVNDLIDLFNYIINLVLMY